MANLGVELQTPDEWHEHFDFIIKGPEGKRMPIDIACLQTGLRVSLDQTKYPLARQWGLFVVWLSPRGPDFFFIPSWAWLTPGGIIRASPNARSRRGPSWDLVVDPHSIHALEPYRVPHRHWTPPQPSPNQVAMMMSMSARPDIPQAREIPIPWHFPEATRTGKAPVRGIRVSSPLYGAFKQFLKKREGRMSMNDAIENFMAWVLGIDCPNSPHLDKFPLTVRQELEDELKRGKRLPSYYIDEPGFPR